MVVVTTEDGRSNTIDVPATESVENFKALIEVEFEIPLSDQILVFNGTVLDDNTRSLSDYGVPATGVVLARKASSAVAERLRNFFANSTATTAPATPSGPYIVINGRNMPPAEFMTYLKSDPEMLGRVVERDARLADAVLNDNIVYVTEYVAREFNASQRERQLRARVAANPNGEEAQTLMYEEIRRQNVNENYRNALEHNPEVFASVVMLYIDCVVNGVAVKAFVDSGAQSTIMSQRCAERCAIGRLVDTRFSGVAQGIGSAKIIGKVHSAPISIGGEVYLSSFTILEGQQSDFILGLDMLKKHRCAIDLRRHVLRIGKDHEVSFLAEADTPGHAEALAEARLVAGTSATDSQDFPEDVVVNLMGMGYERAAVLRALQLSEGDAEAAGNVLLNGL